ncbi:MAG: hypothetical protein ABFR97_10810 [Thermodesulfobacteriota bacterium]
MLLISPGLAWAAEEGEGEGRYFSPSQNSHFDYYLIPPAAEVKGIFIYMHGAGGGHEQGLSDSNFAATFKRLKETLNKAGLLYVCPATAGFGRDGGENLRELAHELTRQYQVPIYLAGASAGTHNVARAIQGEELFAGAILISPTLRARDMARPVTIPLFVTHARQDQFIPLARISALVAGLKERGARVEFLPVRGHHDSPLEKMDWARSLTYLTTKDAPPQTVAAASFAGQPR